MHKTIDTALKPLQGSVTIPGDKSISHRAVLFAAIAEGPSVIKGFLNGQDCLSTISCMRKLGVKIEEDGEIIRVEGKGLHGLNEPSEILDVGNSGTTVRLLSGILAGQSFSSVMTGDESIGRRPMRRVTGPLKMMNASIDGRDFANYTPLCMRGGSLQGVHYVSPVASAQVKSAVLLAGLYAQGVTRVTEPHKSRDHTERMLETFGVKVETDEVSAAVSGGQKLTGSEVDVPGDVSSAVFMLAAGALVPGSEITVRNVGMNPTRTGAIDVLKRMNADMHIHSERMLGGEPVADITIKSGALQAVTISGGEIPRLIDEIPVLALLATQAEGTTVIKDAAELKVKETNRIDTVVNQLNELGADCEATDDGMIIHGPTPLKGGKVESFHDHRIGMTMSLAGLIASDKVLVKDTEAIAVSYPGFYKDLEKLMN
ncbi:3-phosphoshikimate 1-carboxyvinyltransferase [Alkalicoccus saliphilus]|jgi:3-phosphoshikimate 1-carboxyvinyltransferase|uniref:3-phosphoshikimate 1-carboxyvinyltransferase n=1 Tax=Alkalicoccus saliphilus TaxID=200989 RepID=A0A2T4UAE4_9BACI|nr:3-phosphoshikimate 1-carboxyvinyltransferase [Alkalicoccus saliphilus]PTL40359.1 3-phosphoshikimate 1-carboxyvinyltransferase [Alkalicoccus saliphilus]